MSGDKVVSVEALQKALDELKAITPGMRCGYEFAQVFSSFVASQEQEETYARRVANTANTLLLMLDKALTNLERQHKTGNPYWKRLRVRKRLVQTILDVAGESNTGKRTERLADEFFQKSDKELLEEAKETKQ